jgi:ribosome-binding factor A
MKQTQRSRRLSELIHRQLSNIMITDYRDHEYVSQATITGVEVSLDLATARIFVSVLNEQHVAEVIKGLQAESKIMRYLLAKKLNLRLTPRLEFVYDHLLAQGQKLSSLINKIPVKDEEDQK